MKSGVVAAICVQTSERESRLTALIELKHAHQKGIIGQPQNGINRSRQIRAETGIDAPIGIQSL